MQYNLLVYHIAYKLQIKFVSNNISFSKNHNDSQLLNKINMILKTNKSY